MKAFSSPSNPELEEQASVWTARLEGGSITHTQRHQLEVWLDSDPLHREALAAYGQFSADLEQILPELVVNDSIQIPAETFPAPPRATNLRGWLTGAGLVAMAAAAVVLLSPPPSPVHPVERAATAIAQRQSVTLPDGTAVDLNAHTSIVVTDTATERRVRLAGGQAFFRVTKISERPFIVDTPVGAIRVTGTAFDIRQTVPGQIEITVQEGSVQVRLGANYQITPSVPFTLTAGDQLSATTGAPVLRQLSDGAVADLLAWRKGVIVFDGVRLEDAVARFAHYHGRGITVAAEVADLEIGGRFEIDKLDEFLADLERILPVRILQDLSGTTRIELRS